MSHFFCASPGRVRLGRTLRAVVAAALIFTAGCDELGGSGPGTPPPPPPPREETLPEKVTRSIREIGQEIREKQSLKSRLESHVAAGLDGLHMHQKFPCVPGCTDCVRFTSQARNSAAELAQTEDALGRLAPLEVSLREMLTQLLVSVKEQGPSPAECRARELLDAWELLKKSSQKLIPHEMFQGKSQQGQ